MTRTCSVGFRVAAIAVALMSSCSEPRPTTVDREVETLAADFRQLVEQPLSSQLPKEQLCRWQVVSLQQRLKGVRWEQMDKALRSSGHLPQMAKAGDFRWTYTVETPEFGYRIETTISEDAPHVEIVDGVRVFYHLHKNVDARHVVPPESTGSLVAKFLNDGRVTDVSEVYTKLDKSTFECSVISEGRRNARRDAGVQYTLRATFGLYGEGDDNKVGYVTVQGTASEPVADWKSLAADDNFAGELTLHVTTPSRGWLGPPDVARRNKNKYLPEVVHLFPELRRPEPVQPKTPPPPAPPLFADLPKEFTVHAIGTYKGLLPLNTRLAGGQDDAAQTDVVVNKPGEHVLLVLTAYASVVWRVGHTEQTQIAAVIVSGHHKQQLFGVPQETPRAISSREDDDAPFRPFYAYEASQKLLAMNEAVRTLVGREIDRFHTRPTDGTFYIGQPVDADAVIYAGDVSANDDVVPPQPSPGDQGIDELLAQKKLRLAEQADIDAWIEKASEDFKRFGEDLRVTPHLMNPQRTYVVLDTITLPDELYGGHSRSFIIPDNVRFPAGPLCHNSFFLMDGTSFGPGDQLHTRRAVEQTRQKRP